MAQDNEFPKVPVGMGLTVGIVLITPQFAEESLRKLHPKQRNIKHRHIRSLDDDMRNGRFVLNGETIIFSSDGYLIDGQHRLTSVMHSGVSYPSLVVWGVDPKAYSTLDEAAKRLKTDHLGKVPRKTDLGAAAVLFVRYEKKKLKGMDHMDHLSISGPALDDILAVHPGLVEATSNSDVIAAGHVIRKIGVAIFSYYVLSNKDKPAADRFFAQVGSGENLQKGDPALALRRRYEGRSNDHRGSESPDEAIRALFKAWHYLRAGQKIVNLMLPDGEKLYLPW